MVDEDFEPENIFTDNEKEDHVIVARSADPDRESRSINIDDIPSSNNEIDNHIEMHNKRKYYEIRPTKTIDYLRSSDDEIFMSSGFGDRLDFRFPGEEKRVPIARALTLSGPRIRPTAVQPIFATANHNQGRQNTEIQNIITGIVKLLNGNVNVQANSQLLNGRPGRPMASRINNRGPPRISDLPPLPEFDPPVTPPVHAYQPTKTPPPYPFDRPPYHGVNLPEQIVPPLTHRPGFHRPMPPWQRPRPRPPANRPRPGLPMYKPLPPLPADLPDLEDKKPEEELTVSENETSHSENNLHHDDKDILHLLNLPENNSTETEEEEEEERLTTTPETTSSSTTTTSTTTTTTTTEATTSTSSTTTTQKPTTKTTTTERTTEKPTTQPATTEKITTTSSTTTEKPKTEKLTKPDKKKDTVTEKDKINKDKYKIVDEKPPNKVKNETVTQPSIEPSIVEIKTTTTSSIDVPTPTEGLMTHSPTVSGSPSSMDIVKTSSINSQPLPCKYF